MQLQGLLSVLVIILKKNTFAGLQVLIVDGQAGQSEEGKSQVPVIQCLRCSLLGRRLGNTCCGLKSSVPIRKLEVGVLGAGFGRACHVDRNSNLKSSCLVHPVGSGPTPLLPKGLQPCTGRIGHSDNALKVCIRSRRVREGQVFVCVPEAHEHSSSGPGDAKPTNMIFCLDLMCIYIYIYR